MCSFHWLLYLFILLAYGKNIHASFSTECNPVYCFSVLDSLFDTEGEDSCLKAAKLVKCASPCFKPASESVMIEALKVLEGDLCSDFYLEDSINVNKCLSKQKYAIFSCFYKFYNSEADDPRVDPKVLKCRISLNVGICERLTEQCTSRASYISESLLKKFFNTFLSDCSDIDGDDIQNIRLKTSHFKEYGLLAECLDKNNNFVSQCFSKAVADLSLTSSKNICRKSAVTQCIEDIVLNNCDSRLHIFQNISRSLSEHITPICSNTDIVESPEYKKLEMPKLSTVSNSKEFSDLPKTEKFTESVELSSIHSLVSFDSSTKDLSTAKNNHESHSNNEMNSDFLGKALQNITTFPVNNTVLSSNSTPPIVIHKHTVVTVLYRAKSDAGSLNVFFALIGIVCLFQYLSAEILI